MPEKPSLIGKRFGRLVVLEETRKANSVAWICKCDCGGEKITRTNLLTSGKTKSCGCIHTEMLANRNQNRRIDIMGNRYGRLLVVQHLGIRGGAHVWKCACDCGNVHKATTSSLLGGLTLSCGCLKTERHNEHLAANFLNLEGESFGRLLVLGHHEKRDGSNIWLCKCECGKLSLASTGALRSGHRTSCGCFSMIQTRDLIGEKFGRLLVTGKSDQKKYRQTQWECTCDCGKKLFILTAQLTTGKTQSCGCLRDEKTSARFRKHGQAGSKEYSAQISAKRRAMQRELGGSFTVAEIQELFVLQEGKCVYCKADLSMVGFHRDHMTPLVRGGSNEISNIQLLCPNCNRRKHDKTHEEFIMSRNMQA